MSKYTLEYIQNVLRENNSAGSAAVQEQGTKYTLEYIQSVLDRQGTGAGSQSSGGPLQTGKGGGGRSAAPAVQDTAPAVQSPLEQLFGPRLDTQQQQTMRQAIAAIRPTPAPAAQGISADVLLPYRQIGERGAAARQVDENPQLKLLGTPARHQGRQVPGKAPAAQSAAPAVSATWRANAGMDAQQAPAWQQEAQQQRQSAAQGVPARQANAVMGTSAAAPQQESESQRRRREARQRALQLNKEALESGASTLDTKSALVELRMKQQQAAYEAQGQEARMEQNLAGGQYAPGNTLLGTVQRSGEGLREQELKNEAAQALAEMTGPEEYLAKDKLSEIEKQAALLLLNRYKEENPGKLDRYDALPEQELAEVDQWLALEYKLGSFTSAIDRLAKGARSMQYNLVGTPDVIGKTAQQAAKDTVADWHDPEWSALADQLVQIDRRMEIRRELGGERDPELLELKAQRAALQKQMDAAAQNTPLDLDTYGARALLLGQDQTRQAQTGLSLAGKAAYNVGYSVADNLAVLPLNFIPGVGQAAALGVQGAKAGAQEMVELAQRGVGAEEALARGAIAGGIEAATEKIGMDNLVDIVGKGGKQALNSLLKKQLTELAAKGGQSAGASAAAALLSNATAEGLEEAVGYIANYAADQLFGDPESEFSLEEFLASAGQGAAAGLILGGGGMAANALLGGRAGAVGGENAALQPNATPEAKPEMPALAETYQVLAGLDNSPASRAKGAIMALDVELAQNLAQQEQLKMRVQLLAPDPTKITAVQKAWGEMAKLMDAESKIRLQKEVFQRQAEIGAEAVKATRQGNATATTELPTLMEQLFGPTAAPQQSKPREPSLVGQLLPEHYDPGVTIGRGVKADRTAFAQVDRAARALNRPVVVESLPQGHNGYYKDGVIHISAESQSPVMNVFTHELTHHLETSGEYAALAEHVRASEAMQSFLQATDMTMEEYRSFLKDSYAQMGIRLDGKAVDAEIVANFCEKFLFKDENSVRRLCGEKPGLGRRILDFIRQLLGKLRGDEAAELRQAERLFVNALSGAQAENAGTGPQLSVQGNAHPQANSGGAGAVSYEALTALPDMRLTQISTALPEGMGIGDAARLGVENSRQPGMKNGRVTNRYTGQEIQITAKGLRHGLTSKASMLRNGPYALRAGDILQNAVKVNELAPRGKEARSDIYLGGAVDETGVVHAVRFVVNLYADGQRTADLGDMEVYNGDLYAHTGKKTGTVAPKVPEVSGKAATPTVPTLTIADLLNIVKGKMDDFLSADAQVKIGMPPRKSPDFGDSQLYSVTPQLTPQEWKQGRRTTAAGMEKGTAALRAPEVSNQIATPTVPASTIAGARGKVKPGEAVDAENTVVNDDPAAHTAQEQRLIEAYKAAVDPGLARFYESVKAGQYDGRPYVVGRVTDEAARAMEQLTGKQVQGNLVVLDDNGVQHIERRHGKNGEADHSMANLEDIARINFVLENFDQAYRSEQPAAGYFDSKGKKAPVVVFTKKINGTYYVVEAVSDAKSKRNYIISAYLSREGGKKTAPAQRPLDVQAPKSRPKPEIADTGATYSIPTGGRDVNASGPAREESIDLGGARRWLEQRNEARAHADENYMAMSDREAGRIRVNGPEQALRPLRQAVQANVEGEDPGRMPELPREVVADLRLGRWLYWKDFDRVMDSVAPKGGAARAFLDEHLIKPFLAAKKAYAMNTVSNEKKFDRQMKELGLTRGSKASRYLQWYREGMRPVVGADGLLMEEAAPYTLEDLKADRPKDWQNIVKAEEIYGQWSDDFFEIENRSLEQVYPDAEQEIQERLDKLDAQAKGYGIKLQEAQKALQKIDPADELDYAEAWDNYERVRKQKAGNEAEVERLQEQLDSGEALRRKRLQYRQNYVPHRYETQRGFRGLKNILYSVDQNIDPHLVGVSDYTKPKSRWASWMQHRSKDVFQGMDPISAMTEYIREVEYKAHMDPVIARARALAEELRAKTGNTRNANKLIEWLTDWANDLAGKTGYWDRPVQKEHGRKAMAVLQWLTSRAKANAVMGNLSSAISQVYNLPNAVGMLKNPADMAQGAAMYGKLLSGDAETRTLLEQSGFLTERYALQNLDSELRRLGVDEIDSPEAVWRWISQKPEHMAAFMLEAGDRAVAEYTWLSAYAQAVRKGETDPLAYADELTRKSVGGRGVGEMPLVLRNKIVNLIAPFQVEMTNAFNMMAEKIKKKDLIGLFLTFLMTYALNCFRREYLDGRETGFDPIGAVLDSWEQSGEDEDATMGSRLTATGFRLGGEVLSNMPFGDMVASVALGADSQAAKALFGESDPTRFGTGNIGLSALVDPVIQLGSAAVNHKPLGEVDLKNPLLQLLPSYGGKQIERSVQAAQDMGFLPAGPFGLPIGGERNEAPGSYNNQGNLRFPIETGDLLNVAKGLGWGTYATDEGKEYIQSGGHPKSASYTEAYKEGYDPYDLNQLFPGSGKGAGKVTYEQLTGGAEGAVEVDNWLTDLLRYQENKNVLPSNSTTSVTVEGETVKLTGSKAMEFAQTKAETSYNILETLLPTADRYDRGVQEKYAVRAQDYAHAVAKEQVLGVEPKEGSWIEKVQTYSGAEGAELNDRLVNALLGSSIVAEATADYYPNGRPIEGSRKRKAIAALKEAGFDTKTALQMWEVFN